MSWRVDFDTQEKRSRDTTEHRGERSSYRGSSRVVVGGTFDTSGPEVLPVSWQMERLTPQDPWISSKTVRSPPVICS